MKNKIIYVGCFVIIATVFIASILAQVKPNQEKLEITVKSSAYVYALGETVPLDIEIKNNTEQDVVLSGTSAESGYLQFFISEDRQGEYKKYSNAGWGNKNTKPKVLKFSDAVTSKATILCNAVPELSHLNADAAKEASTGKIVTTYALPEPGDYYIKAVLIIPNPDNPVKIESEAVQITITEPIGADLEVWNKIKDRSDFAYFLQEGVFSIPENKSTERAKFQQEIEQIISRFPDSLYTGNPSPESR